ncbi:MAG TPA: hypothetical protein VK470_15955 [Bacteroidota bacterium]|nr:hypothetical protein [Bacteroidota bacterium]
MKKHLSDAEAESSMLQAADRRRELEAEIGILEEYISSELSLVK